MLTPRVFLAPHRPTLVLDQHRGHRTPMHDALREASERLALDAPEALVVLSARWSARGPFLADDAKRHRTLTDYAGFGVELRHDCDGVPALARALIEAGQKAGMRVGAGSRGVDSGVTVPLHFLVPARALPVVPLSLSDQSGAACRAWGAVIRDVLERWPKRVAFMASGGLSCNEHAWSLKREVPEARTFDESAIAALERGAWDEIAPANRSIRARVRPEAGLRHLEVLHGVVGDLATCRSLCYEGGCGIGTVLMEFEIPPPVEEEE